MAVSPQRKKLVRACVLGVLAVVGYGLFSGLIMQKDAGRLTLYGNVDIRQLDVAFRVGGRISAVLAEEGEEVRAGRILAELDDEPLRHSHAVATANLAMQEAVLLKLERGYRAEEVAQAEAAVVSARAQAEHALREFARIERLRASNAVSQKDFDSAKAVFVDADAILRSATENFAKLKSGYQMEDVEAQRATVAAAKAQRDQACTALEDAVLKAPQDGVVLTRVREAGAMVQPGQTVYSFSLTKPVWIRAYVKQPKLGLIKPGMPVRVAVDSVPEKNWPGTVGFISPRAEFTPKSVETQDVRDDLVYRIRVIAEDPENVMRQGMPVTVTIDGLQ
ncbi:MAG: efflux RND transporter periplasmic adaptor subunit [Desulfovibrionaceae bacterium]|nr:efflux RND transporter periplasmic adaptor subunit [Desulfovibrionaceae bacterium]